MMADHFQRDTGFILSGFKTYRVLEKFFSPVDIVCVKRIDGVLDDRHRHQKAKEHNYYLRGFKYLFIMKK